MSIQNPSYSRSLGMSVLAVVTGLVACSSEDSGNEPELGVGGTNAVGTVSGTTANAGATAKLSTTGPVAASTGGTPVSTSTTNGSAVGGASSTLGTSTSGGTASTSSATVVGGAKTTGGAASSGGASSVGGAKAIGGASANGGASSVGGASSTDCNKTGFYVNGTKIYDAKCKEFIMRGVNYPFAWYATNGSTRFADMASVKANVIRVVLSTGDRWTKTTASDITNLVSWAKTNKLVLILEVHDSTGYGDSAEAKHPDTAVAYWTSSDIATALKGNEAYVMINIANEALGNDTTLDWATFYSGAVAKLRTAGLHHLLVVDAPNWGQDWKNTMRDGSGASTIFAADTDKNVIFSVHMYDVYSSATTVTNYFTNFMKKGVPLIVGEFAADHGTAGNVDEDTILSQCATLGVGYLGWSWSGNSSDLSTLDITTNFNVSSLTTWGKRLIEGTNGIKASAAVCSVFQ